jgi:hypothetical protein
MSKYPLRLPAEQINHGGAIPKQLLWWICARCGAISPTFDRSHPKPEGWVSTVLDEPGLPEVVLCDECAAKSAD